MTGLIGKLAFAGIFKAVGLPIIAGLGFMLLISVKSCLHNVQDAFAAKFENARLIETNQRNHETRGKLNDVHAAVVAEKERLEEDDHKHRVEIDSLKRDLAEARASAEEVGECPSNCLRQWSLPDSSSSP